MLLGKMDQIQLSTVKYSILVNRGLMGLFSPHRGIRQGDPLSPIPRLAFCRAPLLQL